MNKKDSALYYLEIRDARVDSIRELEQRIYIDYYQTKKDRIEAIQINEKIKKNELVLIDSGNKKTFYIFWLFVLLIIGIISFLILKRKYSISRKKISDINREKDQLQNKIMIKNRKITSTLVSQERRFEELKVIKQKLDNSENEDFNNTLNALDKLIKKGVAKENIVDNLLYQNDDLVILLKERFSKLSKTDIVHCLLVNQKITIKDAADLLNVSTHTVRTARYRAKSKLKLTKEDSLGGFIDEIQENLN